MELSICDIGTALPKVSNQPGGYSEVAWLVGMPSSSQFVVSVKNYEQLDLFNRFVSSDPNMSRLNKRWVGLKRPRMPGELGEHWLSITPFDSRVDLVEHSPADWSS